MIAEGDKIKECFDWLWERKKVFALTDLFHYKEKDGKIIAVAGIIHSIGNNSFFLQIEPMMSESPRASYELYNDILKYAGSIGARYLIAGSSNKKVHKNLEKLGWATWNNEVTHYIKEIKCQVEQRTQD